MNDFFMLTCNSKYNPPALYFGNIPVQNISVDEGTMSVTIDEAFDCYDEPGLTMNINRWTKLGDGQFRFSDTRNKLTAVGCDILAFMTDAEGSFGSGCVSLCVENITLDDSCSGIGYCQTAVPRSLKTLNITILSADSHSLVLAFNPCGFAFLADQRTFNVSNFRLSDNPYSTKDYPTPDKMAGDIGAYVKDSQEIPISSKAAKILMNARKEKSIHAKADARIQLGITHVAAHLGCMAMVKLVVKYFALQPLPQPQSVGI
ncbi:hypothetical protein GH714_012690 [Hevea brasiliensis]|uniref:Wall-associated receptor kinase galacturonan-binding domain-containing protein n=1 Tax=Hevea brasiliensis TaxID=3981 RepID=A0A6A6NCL2_HEVBR|nr:hypothetical protein GH714_012690 [Hevea brasiliensis]